MKAVDLRDIVDQKSLLRALKNDLWIRKMPGYEVADENQRKAYIRSVEKAKNFKDLISAVPLFRC
ncbi:MAG: hypothetical protein OEZ34_16060 [Spirochaetia bacterium]|nr:hypothetical protein [Spirochaetia bacterium]